VGLPKADCRALLQWACPRCGLEWRAFHRERGQVCKRIARRMAALGVSSGDEYRALLERSTAEWAAFDALCRVTVSRFYRDRAVFDALRSRLPALAKGALDEDRTLRCWSAGCCSGEEPYTLALVLRRDVQRRLPGLTFDILATDSDPDLLERARRGSYRPSALDELPGDLRADAFEQAGDAWRVRPEYREGLRWALQDLRRTMADGPFDLILCRNVAFSYFAPALQEETARGLVARLVPGGLLLLGIHESLPAGTEGVSQEGHLPIFRRTG
jgi:chemotaxis protein methyltransferase CheR